MLDVSGPAERTGKHRGTDLLDGTVTLPLILARERDPELAALDLRAVRTPAQAEAVCDAIAATGVLERARGEALEMVAGGEGGAAGAAGGAAGGAGAGGRLVADRLRLRAAQKSIGQMASDASAQVKRSTSSSMLARVRRLRSRTSASVPWSSCSSKRSTVSWS